MKLMDGSHFSLLQVRSPIEPQWFLPGDLDVPAFPPIRFSLDTRGTRQERRHPTSQARKRPGGEPSILSSGRPLAQIAPLAVVDPNRAACNRPKPTNLICGSHGQRPGGTHQRDGSIQIEPGGANDRLAGEIRIAPITEDSARSVERPNQARL